MKTVVILLSDKRSGSTMLQSALCAHSQVQTVNYSPHTYLETHHWLKGAVLLDYNKALFSNGRVYSNYGSKKNTRTYTIDLLDRNIENYRIPNDDKELIFQGWERLCDTYAKPVFFEKSPQFLAHWAALSLIMEWIQQTKYTVKIIGLVRNPMAVQYSAFKLFRSQPSERQYGWLTIYKNLLALQQMLKKEQYFQISYENIVDEPEINLKNICDFIGIPYEEKMSENINGSSLTKWKNDRFFTLDLDPAVIQMAKLFGYEEDVLKNDNSKKPSDWNMLLWQINTLLLKLKNKVINRIIAPLVLKVKIKKNK